jgi:hypothetical protein
MEILSLIGDEIVIGDAPAGVIILVIRPNINGAPRYYKLSSTGPDSWRPDV